MVITRIDNYFYTNLKNRIMVIWKIVKKMFSRKGGIINESVENKDVVLIDKQQIDYSQFQREWNAQRLIEQICQYKAMFGDEFHFYENARFHKSEDDYVERPLKRIMRERINAVVEAYGKYIFGTSSLAFHGFIDENCSENKRNELEILLKEILLPEDFSPRWSIQRTLKEHYNRVDMFSYILKFRTSIMKLELHGTGLLECNAATSMAKQMTERLYKDCFEITNNKLDRILILLMGDEFDKKFSEEELIRQYNYPSITDNELREMDLDWMVGE